MAKIEGSPEDVLATVQEIVERHIPGVVCELQRYKTQIGCGALDERGTLHEIQLSIRGISEYHAESQAKAVASRLAPRTVVIGRRW